MFLSNKPTKQFGWKFLDLRLVYRYNERAITHYLPLCPSARKALLKMYTSFGLPETISRQLNIGKLSGNEFEEALFTQLASRCNTTIQLNTTDLNNKKKNLITLQFDDYDIIKPTGLSLGPGFDRVLGRGFDKYLRFDYMLGPIFMQVSVSTFTTHNQASADIEKAFKEMAPQGNISQAQINGRNQIEMYLDEMYGSGHSAKIDPITKKFIVTRNNNPMPGFRIVYFQGSPGTPNHSHKVKDFPDVAHVTLEEIKSKLFSNIE